MGLIINKTIPMLMKGYPTVSDKYNVAGGTLEGTAPAMFGELVQFGSTAGYFKAINATDTIAAVTSAAGIIVATNVKVAENFPGTVVQVNPGEAFNLLVNGFIAVELASTATASEVTANAAVYVTGAGKFTTTSDSAKLAAALPNAVYTGMKENKGTADAPKWFAEIYVK